ncbi:platelet glycoprotein V-like [Centruroides vittatus]|uniref:platelet glycoprotein V-like n=1 Tax=Centruroides vittatus TaxID=120091 RepID=UPI003510C06C
MKYLIKVIIFIHSWILVFTSQCLNMYRSDCENFRLEACPCTISTDINEHNCIALLNCVHSNRETFQAVLNSFTLKNKQNINKLLLINATVSFSNFSELTRSDTDHLSNAKHLKFSHDGIERISADTFLMLKELVSLDLSNNKISDLPENVFSSLIYLRLLNLSHNVIHTLRSNIFKNLTSLISLDLSENNLTEIPEDLFSWMPLVSLSLSKNKITSFPKKIFVNLKHLHELDLSYNNLMELSPQWLRPLTNLQAISIAYNKLTTIRKEVFENDKLNKINLIGNLWNCNENMYWLYLFIEENKGKFEDLSSVLCQESKYGLNETIMNILEIVHLEKQINNTELCNFCNCSLNQDRRFVAVDCSNRNLTALPELLPIKTRQVALNNNQITSLTIKDSASHWEYVRFLYLSNNHISSLLSLQDFKFHKNLIELNLSNNKLKEVPIYLLDKLTKLEISLGGNPWKCDCNTVRFKTWLQDNYQMVVDIGDIRCAPGDLSHSNSVIYYLQKSDLCPQERFIDYLDILNVVMGILIVVIISKVTYDYWRQKRTGKLPRFFSLN